MKCINLKNERKISFSNDSKKYDGSSYKNIIYSEIIFDLLNYKINTKNDILNKTKNIRLIIFFLYHSYNIKNKLNEATLIKCGSRDIIYKIKIKHIILLNKLIKILEDIEICDM